MGMNKFVDHTASARGQVHWGRVDRDGAPFRSSAPPPYLTDEEYEAITERVEDVLVATFDTSKPEEKRPLGHPQAKTYNQVLEGICAGWLRCLNRDHRWDQEDGSPPKMYVYIEWTEPYLEPRKRGAALGDRDNDTSAASGSQNGFI